MSDEEIEDEVPPLEEMDAATQVTHRLSPSTRDSKNSDKISSDYGIPDYMQPTQAFQSMLNVQRQHSFNLSSGLPAYHRVQRGNNKWQVRKLDPNEWRSNSIDSAYGSLYTLKPETVAEPGELPEEPSRYRDEEEGEFFTGIDYNHAREKSYIERSSLDVPSPVPGLLEQRRFSEHIIQEYHKPKRLEVPGYGAPHCSEQPGQIKDTNDVVEMVVRPPSSYNVMPKRQKPAKCDRPSVVSCEFCEVLGPLACHECIESTNRRIAHDVEHAAFPQLECTASSLVAPALSQLMSKGEKIVRRKRVHHGRVDTIIEPALSNKASTHLVLPPIGRFYSPPVDSVTKEVTTRPFRSVRSETNRYDPTRRTKLPAIAGMKEKNTFQRIKRNIIRA